MAHKVNDTPHWHLVPAFFAWLVPGLGHWVLGQHRRALILGVSIGLLWLIGLFIGGIGVIDAMEHRPWFLGQAMMAPSVAVNLGTQRIKKAQLANTHSRKLPIYQPSFAHVKEQGILFTALAGLLNFLAIVDVLCHPSHSLDRAKAEPSTHGGAT